MKIYVTKASGILYAAYSRFKGVEPEQICYQTGIGIRKNPRLGPNQSYLYGKLGGPYYIELPIINFKLKSDYLVYHESAHFFLVEEGIPIPFGEEEYWTQEVWCNNFAFAMIASLFNINLVSERNALNFFDQNANPRNDKVINKQIAEHFNSLLQEKLIPAKLQRLIDSLKDS